MFSIYLILLKSGQFLGVPCCSSCLDRFNWPSDEGHHLSIYSIGMPSYYLFHRYLQLEMEKETQSNLVLFHVCVPGSTLIKKNQGYFHNFLELFCTRTSLLEVKLCLEKNSGILWVQVHVDCGANMGRLNTMEDLKQQCNWTSVWDYFSFSLFPNKLLLQRFLVAIPKPLTTPFLYSKTFILLRKSYFPSNHEVSVLCSIPRVGRCSLFSLPWLVGSVLVICSWGVNL